MEPRLKRRGRGKLVLAERICAAGLVVLVLGVLPDVGWGQKLVQGSSTRFAEYYPTPHETQMKSLVQGAKLEPQDAEGKKILITDAKVQTFRENGAAEMVIVAPQALYDSFQRSISSPGSLRMETADGKFSIQGEGFCWQQTNSMLYISNQVHTVIHPELLEKQAEEAAARPAAQPNSGMTVDSDSFDYSADSGLGAYRHNVRVTGTNLALASGLLTVLLPMKERQLQSITAERQLVMDYETDSGHVHATGENAVYTVATGSARVTGHPAWSSEGREGHGDEVLIDRTNKIFTANGNAFLKMPARNAGGAGLLGQAASSATNSMATNQFIEINCDKYIFRTNYAVFDGPVRLAETADGQPRGTMTCVAMVATFAGTNELQTLLAETNVVINREDAEFKGQRALYTGTNGSLELTGNPSWRSGTREGKGERLVADLRRNDMLVEGDAYMRLPANELGATLPSAGGEQKPASTSDTNAFAEVFSRDYHLKPESARFTGGVRILHPRMNWTCDNMTAKFSPSGPRNANLVAEQQVAFVLNDEQGHNVRGDCYRAEYIYTVTDTATNDLMKLTGDPVVQTTNGVFRNSVILYDRSRNTLTAPGHYKIQGTAKAIGTNAFKFPKTSK